MLRDEKCFTQAVRLFMGDHGVRKRCFSRVVLFAVCDLVLLGANRERALSSIAECGRWCNINERGCDEFGSPWNVNSPMSVCSLLLLQRLHDPLIVDYPASVLRKTRCFNFCALPASDTIGDSEEKSGVAWHERWRRSSITAANRKASVIKLPVIVRSEVVDCAISVSDSCAPHPRILASPQISQTLSAVRRAVSGSTAGVSGRMPCSMIRLRGSPASLVSFHQELLRPS
jgi:hypothetical protein